MLVGERRILGFILVILSLTSYSLEPLYCSQATPVKREHGNYKHKTLTRLFYYIINLL